MRSKELDTKDETLWPELNVLHQIMYCINHSFKVIIFQEALSLV